MSTNVDDQTRDFLKQIELNLDVRQFFAGEVGQEVLSKADASLKALFDKWKMSDPRDETAQANLQLEVRVIERLRNWLNEIILSGEQSEQYVLNRDKGEIDV